MFSDRINLNSSLKMKVNFNLQTKAKTKDKGKSQIWLTTTIKGKRVRIYTGLRILPDQWNNASRLECGERAFEDGHFSAVDKKANKEINKRLNELCSYCNDFIKRISRTGLKDDSLEYSAQAFKDYIYDRMHGLEAEQRKDPTIFVKEYIRRKTNMVNKETGRKICSGTVYNHINALSRLQKYCSDNHYRLTWELFDRSLEEKLTTWMNTKNYSANTISSQFSIMKVWLTEAELHGLIKDPAFHRYSTKSYDVDNIYLSEEEITRIYSIDFSDNSIKAQIDNKSSIEQTRDLFIVACWTGLRFGDWHDLSNATISSDRISIVTHKTNKSVTIPLLPQVKAILEKYNGHLPQSVDKAHTIEQIRLCGKLAGIEEDVVLKRIKGGQAENRRGKKYEFIGNHTARRSFATNMYLRKVPTLSIMAITGHKTETNFMKYIKVDAEQHAKIVESYFDK